MTGSHNRVTHRIYSDYEACGILSVSDAYGVTWRKIIDDVPYRHTRFQYLVSSKITTSVLFIFPNLSLLLKKTRLWLCCNKSSMFGLLLPHSCGLCFRQNLVCATFSALSFSSQLGMQDALLFAVDGIRTMSFSSSLVSFFVGHTQIPRASQNCCIST